MLKSPVKNLYEALVILRSNLSEDDLEKNITQIETAIKNYGGTVIKIDEPMRRRFTHNIKGNKEGYYVSVLFNSPSEAPNTLKRTLSIADDVLRFVVVRKENKK